MSTLDNVNIYSQTMAHATFTNAQEVADRIDAGTLTYDDLVAFLQTVDEYQQTASVIKLYQGVFDRMPDPGGLAFWVGEFRNLLADGQGDYHSDLVQLLQVGNWLSSPEYVARFGNTTNEELVTLMLQQYSPARS